MPRIGRVNIGGYMYHIINRANAYFLHGDFYNAKDDYACIAVKFFKEKVAPLLKEYGVII